jgi:hypothetical protein
MGRQLCREFAPALESLLNEDFLGAFPGRLLDQPHDAKV